MCFTLVAFLTLVLFSDFFQYALSYVKGQKVGFLGTEQAFFVFLETGNYNGTVPEFPTC